MPLTWDYYFARAFFFLTSCLLLAAGFSRCRELRTLLRSRTITTGRGGLKVFKSNNNTAQYLGRILRRCGRRFGLRVYPRALQLYSCGITKDTRSCDGFKARRGREDSIPGHGRRSLQEMLSSKRSGKCMMIHSRAAGANAARNTYRRNNFWIYFWNLLFRSHENI